MPPAWGGSPFEVLTVPSGGTCLVRKLQPADLAGGDVLGATDLLGSIVQERIEGAKRRRPQDHKKPEAEQRKEDEQKALERISEALSTPGSIYNMVDQVA